MLHALLGGWLSDRFALNTSRSRGGGRGKEAVIVGVMDLRLVISRQSLLFLAGYFLLVWLLRGIAGSHRQPMETLDTRHASSSVLVTIIGIGNCDAD